VKCSNLFQQVAMCVSFLTISCMVMSSSVVKLSDVSSTKASMSRVCFYGTTRGLKVNSFILFAVSMVFMVEPTGRSPCRWRRATALSCARSGRQCPRVLCLRRFGSVSVTGSLHFLQRVWREYRIALSGIPPAFKGRERLPGTVVWSKPALASLSNRAVFFRSIRQLAVGSDIWSARVGWQSGAVFDPELASVEK
jgi:hypothetical protein